MEPKISVIVPCYNVEAYLPKCIESIISQTYNNIEIILVDDGSPDNCGKICDEYANKDNRIRVIHKENGGLSDARNVGIDVASGEWITFVDSDDYVSYDYVETLYGLVERNNCTVGVACLHEFLEDCSPKICQKTSLEIVFSKWEGIEKMFYQELFDNTAPCKIYHRSLFVKDLRFPRGLYYEDLATVYLIFMRADKVAFCNKEVYYYLLRKNSIEGQAFNVHKLDSALKIKEMISNNLKGEKCIENAVRCRLFSFCLHILSEMPADYPDNRKQILIDYVKQNRLKILCDKKARKKAKAGAIISYLGLATAKRILNKVKNRNK